MTALATAAALTALATVFAAAWNTPRDAEGRPVPRSQRTLWSDLRALVG